MGTSSRVGRRMRACACNCQLSAGSVPTRYGRAISQVDAFFDQTGGLWVAQKLNGKMATILTGTGTQVGAPFLSLSHLFLAPELNLSFFFLGFFFGWLLAWRLVFSGELGRTQFSFLE
jgi:hypothetical protein